MASRRTRATPPPSISTPWTGTDSHPCTGVPSSPSATGPRWRRRPMPPQPMLPSLGTSGDALAEDHLLGLGYRIVGRDVRTPLGQLDLVAVDGATPAFVEAQT